MSRIRGTLNLMTCLLAGVLGIAGGAAATDLKPQTVLGTSGIQAEPASGYTVRALPGTSRYVGALAVAPDSDQLIMAMGGWGDMNLYRYDPASGDAVPVTAGAEDRDGDDQLDTNFGSLSGLSIWKPITGGPVLYFMDSSIGSLASPGQGERLYVAEDLNGDGDYMDVIEGKPEIRTFYDPDVADYMGADAVIVPGMGGVLVTEAVGAGLGTVTFIDFGGSATLLATGFDYTSGVEVHPETGEIYVGNVTTSFRGQVYRLLEDQNGNGILEVSEPGEVTIAADTDVLSGCFDMVFDGVGDLYVSVNDGAVCVRRLDHGNAPALVQTVLSGLIFGTGIALKDRSEPLRDRATENRLYVGEGGWSTQPVVFEVTALQPGDMEPDGDLDLDDLIRLVDLVLDRPPPASPHEHWAGDLQRDGDLDVFDIVSLIDLILER